ncbi:transglutaminase-like domain-containing protein [Vulcanisaeta distributa]|uniref:transglutaminase-like domain-containing protein n=1 Tax=Vulcanisaeta distributa TaxID=164451 RepID=UPI001FB3156A|nr:transglutaminase-like domain-containing protein [Vulcanisaeta distributa]
MRGQGIFPGILDFINNTDYIGFYEGSINGTSFTGTFIPMIEVNKPGTLSYSESPNLISANLTIYIKSEIPVLLRYFVFDSYNSTSNELINTWNSIPVITSYPPITINLAVGTDCNTYIIYENFSQPIEAIPIPFIINMGKSLVFVVSNITLMSVIPYSEVSMLEPGDLLMSKDPINAAVFKLTVCRISPSLNYTGIEALYARDYAEPLSINIPWGLIPVSFNASGILAIKELLSYLNSGHFTVSNATYPPIDYTLINGTGSYMDYVVLTMAILRSLGIPTRAALGFTGERLSGDVYVYHVSGSAAIWVEAFTNFGWVAFEPISTSRFNDYAQLLSIALYTALVSLLLMVPWIIGYYIYYYLNKKS